MSSLARVNYEGRVGEFDLKNAPGIAPEKMKARKPHISCRESSGGRLGQRASAALGREQVCIPESPVPQKNR